MFIVFIVYIVDYSLATRVEVLFKVSEKKILYSGCKVNKQLLFLKLKKFLEKNFLLYKQAD